MLNGFNITMPQRLDGDGTRQWHERHREAAILWAKTPNIGWEAVAQRLGISYGSARKYATLQGFAALIRYFAALERQKEYEQLASQKLDLIMRGETVAFATLLEMAQNEEVDHKVRTDAAYKLLQAMGVVAKNEAIGKAVADQINNGTATGAVVSYQPNGRG